ncbi:MAG TPA: glucoamylase family protein [Gemmatimonadaceae bacterium]
MRRRWLRSIAAGAGRTRYGLAALVCAAAVVAQAAACAPARIPPAPASLRAEPFLDTLQSRTFDWFWKLGNRQNGLIFDRWPTPSFSSVAAVGFGLTAYPIGVERGYISRAQAAERARTTLEFFWKAPQGPQPAQITGHRGFFYHFLDMQTGHRFQTVELSTIDTALLLAGALVCREYFDGPGTVETAIRDLADSIYFRVDWKWAQVRAPLVSMGWRPEDGFIAYDWRGYNEAMILLILALGSPTHPIEPAAWDAWTQTYSWSTFQGQTLVQFAPLFGHQYSHVWIDFRGIRDRYMRERGIDYFENSRRATYSQRTYAMANPMRWRGYGADIWGLTAADGPIDTTISVSGVERRFFTYAARGAAANEIRDDGTIAPTAAGGSVPFAPEIAIPALKSMRRAYSGKLFTEYGFLDSFNPTFTFTGVQVRHGRVDPVHGWYDTDHLGIDQGPILAMVENYRSELIWRLMRKNPHIRRGLERAGFTGGWLASGQ